MRVYVTKSFRRFQRKERIEDRSLREAVTRADDGLVDADLGAGLIKQRVARAGQGKRGGYRTILAYRTGERAVFLYGFAKSERDNIGAKELEGWREIGSGLLRASQERLDHAVENDEMTEVYDDEED